MSETLCAAVVTYNRRELLAKLLQSLHAQTRRPNEIVVINNACTDGTPEMLAEKFPDVKVVTLPENLGASGGFHAGMKWGYDNGFDYIWVSDDDAMPCRTALQRMLEQAREIDAPADKPVALWSHIVTETPPEQVPPPEPTEIVATAVNRSVDHGMFVGFCVPRRTVELIGLPRQDLFIYCDDEDFCIRIRQGGGAVYEIGASVVYHKDWQGSIVRKRIVGPISISYPQIPHWKIYYLLRNQTLTYRKVSLVKSLRVTVRAAILLCKCLWAQPEHARWIILGAGHGLAGIAGIKLRPGGAKPKD